MQVVSPNDSVVSSTSSTGNSITINDMVALTGLSKVSVMKLVKSSGLKSIGKAKSGSRGRPSSLFSRVDFMTAWKGNSGNSVKADAVADPVDGDPDLALALAAQLD